MDMQNHLTNITNWIINDLKSDKVRAVDAIWEEDENTASLSFYIDGDITEEEYEDFSIACAEIIAHCSNGLLKEKFIRWDYPKPLPSQFLAYKRDEK